MSNPAAPIHVLGVPYDRHELHPDVVDAFFVPAFAIAAARRAFQETAAPCCNFEQTFIEPAERHAYIPPDFDAIAEQLRAARARVDSSTRLGKILYVAEYGPLSEPANVIGNDGRNLFERSLDEMLLPAEELRERWSDGWESIDEDEQESMILTGALFSSVRLRTCPVRDAPMTVSLMWQQAEAATRLLRAVSSAFPLVIHASWVFGRLGHLVQQATGYGDRPVVDGYPLADRVPGAFGHAGGWLEYESLMDALIDLAGQHRPGDKDVLRPFVAAKFRAREEYQRESGASAFGVPQDDNVHVDPVDFATAYRDLRSEIVTRMAGVAPTMASLWQPSAVDPAQPTADVGNDSDENSKNAPAQVSAVAAEALRGGYLSTSEGAREYGVDPDALRQRMNRWREKNPGSDGYTEVPDRGARSPAYLYRRSVMKPIVDQMKAEADARLRSRRRR